MSRSTSEPRRVVSKGLGFFTRVLDDAPPAERYRLALEQIGHAERFGLGAAWVAQHHFDGEEGGLPAPLVFLAQVAAHTSHIRLGTGIITLPMENPVRVAEDTAVLDILSGGRLEVGVGKGERRGIIKGIARARGSFWPLGPSPPPPSYASTLSRPVVPAPALRQRLRQPGHRAYAGLACKIAPKRDPTKRLNSPVKSIIYPDSLRIRIYRLPTDPEAILLPG